MENLTQIQFEDIQLRDVYICIFGYTPFLGESELTKCTGQEILKRLAMEVEEDMPEDYLEMIEWSKTFIKEYESDGIDYCLMYKLY